MTDPTTDGDWDDIGYLLGSHRRQTIFHALGEKPRIPTQLAAETGIAVPHVSHTLTDLRNHDLVTLLVSDDTHKGRVYGLSDRGQELYDENPHGVFDADTRTAAGESEDDGDDGIDDGAGADGR